MKRLILVVLGICLAGTNAFAQGNDEYTVLLLHFNGEDGSTNIVDNSAGNHTVTANGDAQIDTAESKFGGASVLFDGNGDYLSIPDSADWDICASTSDDWTMDLWMKHNVYTGGAQIYIQQYQNGDRLWHFQHHYNAGGLLFYVYSDGVELVHTGYEAKISDTNWHHIALCKVGNEYGIYKDGQQVAYAQSNSTDNYTGNLYIGSYHGASYFANSYLDELRIAHANPFNASPNSGNTDSITVPTSEYTAGPPHNPPSADAGPDIEASAGQEVTLDGSFSSPDAEIVSWVWRSLSDPQKPIVAEGRITTMNAHGYVEEIIELTVSNNYGETDTDTMTIISPGVIGPPGVTPEEIAIMEGQITTLQQENTVLDNQVTTLQQQNTELGNQVTILQQETTALQQENAQQQQTLDDNRHLLKQLPQLKHDLEELLF